jgi:WXXGXW repeat (2 copies)
MNTHRAAVRWMLLAIIILSFSIASFSQIAVGISVRVGPPPLPVYAQPICPGPGYFWTPGYWAWNDDDGYYWVPGTWVVAPVGMLWTPGYWGWGGGVYEWYGGYWGPHIGFYGGINYGFGYTGVGFGGGEWRGREFYYNRSVTNVSVTNVTNVYNRTVVVNNTRTVSYNGGRGGIEARPTPQEARTVHERHVAPLAIQSQHEHMASQNRQNFASENHGRPAVAATSRPGDFSSHSAVPARASGGEYHPPAMSPKQARVASTPGKRGTSNEGFRPFTPPSKNGTSAPNTARGGESHPNQTHPNQTRPNQTRPNLNHPNENRPNESRPSGSRPIEARPSETRPQNRPPETRPQNRPTVTRPQNERSTPHSAPPPRESAPRQNSRPPSPPAHRPSAPNEQHPKGR